MFSTIPSLKQIGSQVSRHMKMLTRSVPIGRQLTFYKKCFPSASSCPLTSRFFLKFLFVTISFHGYRERLNSHASAVLLGLSDLVPSLSAAVPAHSASQREQSASMQWREPSLFLLFSRLVTGFLQQKIRTLTLFSPWREPLEFVLECLDCKSRVNFDWGPVLSLN